MAAAVDLYWLPLGAGGWFVRLNGRLFEALSARHQHRPPCDLYHSALEVRLDGERYVIEMAPVWNERAPDRGVVAEGPVGARWAGRFRAFRYEIRRWRGGRIPDVGEAVAAARLTEDPDRARRLLDLVPQVPTPVWTANAWNCNSLTSWLLSRSGLDTSALRLPTGGRAPGWDAGNNQKSDI
jgi:hypothetical protein